MNRTTMTALTAAALMATVAGAGAQTPVGNAFTYQGKLTDGGAPATGQYDLTFRLYTASNALFAIGNPVSLENVQVSGGLFTVRLDFGSEFNGDARWLGVFVRPGANTGSFTALSPRQEITPAPNAINASHISLPLSQAGASEPSIFFESGLLHISQTGGSNAIMGQTSGSGAGIRGTASAADGIGVHGTTAVGTAGWFENTSAANSHTALLGRSNGAGYGVYAQNVGTGTALGALQNGSSGEAAHLRVTGFGNQSPALRAETDNSGPAVYAWSQSGPALEVGRGGIKVDGAGVNTNTFVFRHHATASSISGDDTYINNSLCNGRPDAILFAISTINFAENT